LKAIEYLLRKGVAGWSTVPCFYKIPFSGGDVQNYVLQPNIKIGGYILNTLFEERR
jgi:hypothetical protein